MNSANSQGLDLIQLPQEHRRQEGAGRVGLVNSWVLQQYNNHPYILVHNFVDTIQDKITYFPDQQLVLGHLQTMVMVISLAALIVVVIYLELVAHLEFLLL